MLLPFCAFMECDLKGVETMTPLVFGIKYELLESLRVAATLASQLEVEAMRSKDGETAELAGDAWKSIHEIRATM